MPVLEEVLYKVVENIYNIKIPSNKVDVLFGGIKEVTDYSLNDVAAKSNSFNRSIKKGYHYT